MGSTLTILPIELLLVLLRCLARTTSVHDPSYHPAQSILAFALTCKTIYRLVEENEDLIWRQAYRTLVTKANDTSPLSPPSLRSRHPRSASTLHSPLGQTKSWKRIYMIYRGWKNRKAKPLVLSHRPLDEQSSRARHQVCASENSNSLDKLAQSMASSDVSSLLDSVEEDNDQMSLDGYRTLERRSIKAPPPLPATWIDTCQSMTTALSSTVIPYSKLVAIPRLKLLVRSNRLLGTDAEIQDKIMMQVLDGRTGRVLDVDCQQRHRSVVSDMAINETQDILVSSSTDGTVRVWTFTQDMDCNQRQEPPITKNQCPLQCMHILRHAERTWVNAVDIQGTTIISGGGDHAVRVWDARTGRTLFEIQSLYTTPDNTFGIFALAMKGDLLVTGTIIEPYYVFQRRNSVSTKRRVSSSTTSSEEERGEEDQGNHNVEYQLLYVLDEPLPSRELHRFEAIVFQDYSPAVAITPSVLITNSKLRGMLCVWSRATGRLLYRIWVTGVAEGFSPSQSPQPNDEVAIYSKDYICRRSDRNDIGEGPDTQLIGIEPLDGIPDLAEIPRGDGYGWHGDQGNNWSDDTSNVHGDEQDDESQHGTDSSWPEDNGVGENIFDFATDPSGEFLMVTLASGRMVLFRFGSSPMEKPVRIRLRASRDAELAHGSLNDNHIRDATAWILFANEQGDLFVDRI